MTKLETPRKDVRNFVVVGAGQAAAWACHTLRSEGFEGDITMVGEESHFPYERPFLSKGMLTGTQNADAGIIFGQAYWNDMAVTYKLGTRVLSLDAGAQTLITDQGEYLAWDRLLICTGGSARTMENAAAAKHIQTLRTIDDAIALRERLLAAGSLLVIGGGWIGLEVASAALGLGLKVTVLEHGQTLCERALPREVGKWLHALHETSGVTIQCGVTVRDVVRSADDLMHVEDSSGRSWTSDLVVAGIGMIPNDAIASQAGIECESGIVVDSACRTSHPHIFAAGDVTASWNTALSRQTRIESWQNAQEQGAAAARAMLGRDVTHDIVPWFWSDQHGRNIQIAGAPSRGDRVETSQPAGGGPNAILWAYFSEDVLVGAVGIDAGRAIRVIRKELGVVHKPARRIAAA